jgi:hypothetical protein
MSSGQMSFWANVFLGKCLLGKCLSGQMSFWADVFWSNVILGKYLSGQMSSEQMSIWANVFLKLIGKIGPSLSFFLAYRFWHLI